MIARGETFADQQRARVEKHQQRIASAGAASHRSQIAKGLVLQNIRSQHFDDFAGLRGHGRRIEHGRDFHIPTEQLSQARQEHLVETACAHDGKIGSPGNLLERAFKRADRASVGKLDRQDHAHTQPDGGDAEQGAQPVSRSSHAEQGAHNEGAKQRQGRRRGAAIRKALKRGFNGDGHAWVSFRCLRIEACKLREPAISVCCESN